MELANSKLLDAAYRWLCHQRRAWPANADVWHLRFTWETARPQLLAQLGAGTYRFAALDKITKANGEVVHVWGARDALVLKVLALALAPVLPVSGRCTHVKGQGGAKAALRAVRASLAANNFVMRTDVKSYYDSIDQHRMLEKLAVYVKDRAVLNLLWQAMRRTVTWGGLYRECPRGISRGCPLSPLLGAFYLHELDLTMARSGWFYVRFMDDILVLAPTRWQLRRGVATVNQQLAALGLAQHPDKTFIGRIAHGFDFLGYHFSPQGLTLAAQTRANFVARYTRLYEQSRHTPEGLRRAWEYVRRWWRWVQGGLGGEAPRWVNAGQPHASSQFIRATGGG